MLFGGFKMHPMDNIAYTYSYCHIMGLFNKNIKKLYNVFIQS